MALSNLLRKVSYLSLLLIAQLIMISPYSEALAGSAYHPILVSNFSSSAADFSHFDIWSGWYAGAYHSYNAPNYSIRLGQQIMSGTDMAGVLLGYNEQHNGFTYGIEGDLLYPKRQDQILVIPNKQCLSFGIRSRFGVDLNVFLPYLAMGFSVDNSQSFSPNSYAGPSSAVGLDFKLTRFLVLRAEAHYVNYSLIYKDRVFTRNTIPYDINTFRLGVIWRF